MPRSSARALAGLHTLPPFEAKLLAIRTAVPVVCALMHAVQTGIFVVLGLPLLGAVSVGSVLLFTTCLLLVRGGHGRAGMWLGYGEIAVHAVLLTVLLGVGSGYVLYLVALACGVILVFRPEERVDRVLGVTLALALTLGLVLRDGGALPGWALGEAGMRGLALLNWVGVLFALVSVVGFSAASATRAERQVARERARSEALLHNVLPPSIAARLEQSPGVLVDEVPSATVLFADLVGFTPLAARLPPTELLGLLDGLFSRFDRLARAGGLEKIKTIGDAYMVVGGVPEPLPEHAARVAEMALGMRVAVAELAARTGHDLQLRVGVHTGPVLAGVIGEEKFAYDLWGDTVNLASRMESHGEPGRIQVTEAVAEALGDGFVLVERGVIEVKGRGPVRAFFLEE